MQARVLGVCQDNQSCCFPVLCQQFDIRLIRRHEFLTRDPVMDIIQVKNHVHQPLVKWSPLKFIANRSALHFRSL